MYTAGNSTGSYRVIARSSNGKADTSGVTIPASIFITGITLSPASVSLSSGQTRQFAASATLSDGSTLSNPVLTWSATGGTISSSGLYTAGSTSGNYRVIGTSSTGKADTAAVTIGSTSSGGSTGGTGAYAHRPSTFTRVLTNYAFNLTSYPAGSSTYQDAPDIGDGSGWGSVGGSALKGVNDPSAPVSPSNVMQWTFPPGSGGTGVGMLYRTIPAGVQQLYIAFPLWHDPNFEWNTISNKLLYWSTLSAEKLILESRFNDKYWAWYIEQQDKIVNPQTNVNPTGRWVNVEILIKRGNPGSLQVWIDGNLVSNYSGAIPTTSGSTELNLNSTWGGGGTRTRTSYRRIDHILIATP
jgi:hypothetical protein